MIDNLSFSTCYTVSKESYVPPPEDFRPMAAQKATIPKYNYLETEVALPFVVPKVKRTDNQVLLKNKKELIRINYSRAFNIDD